MRPFSIAVGAAAFAVGFATESIWYGLVAAVLMIVVRRLLVGNT